MRKRILFAGLLMHGVLSPLSGQPSLDSATVNRLYYTAKVWGFLKYFHSGVARGTGWDGALTATLPKARDSQGDRDFNIVLSGMITTAGPMSEPLSPPPDIPDSLRYNLDLKWLSDPVFSAEVRAALDTVRIWFRPQNNRYVGGFGYPTFNNDAQYYRSGDTLLPAEDIRLLSLCRYWNIINYFFPYKNLIDQKWDDVLREFIPRFWQANDNVSYQLTMMELAARINDAHASTESAVINTQIGGTYYLPIRLKYIGDETVVTKVLGDTSLVKPGDVVRKINGIDIRAVRDSLRRYTQGSNGASLEKNINSRILSGRQNESVQLLLDGPRGQAEVVLTRQFTASTYADLLLAAGPIWKELQPPDLGRTYGYVDMARLTSTDVAQMFNDLWDTDGIIFDCRNNPKVTVGEIVRYLFSAPLNIAKSTVPDIRYPGTMELTSINVGSNNLPNPYRNGLMILLDEETINLAEYMVMGLEQHLGSLKIGSQTGGATGNVLSAVYLPGGIVTSFSGLGVFYPDGRPTQRVGIIPDIVVRPTIEGIRQGRDEVLEVALKQVLQPPDTLAWLEWSWQPPFPQWNDLRAVHAIDANTIFAVGDLGTVVKTTNGGRTWIQQTTETMSHLRGVWATNASTVIAVGDNGTIIRTSDGGLTWTAQTIDPGTTFYGVCFTDTKAGTAVGYPGAIYRTTDGGNTWVLRLSGPATHLRAVSFTNANIGTAVGSSGTIFRTTNGGLKWNRQLSGFEGTDTLLSGVSFTDSLTGTVVGRSGVILRTTNGGTTWTLQQSETAHHLYAVTFTDANNGMAVGDFGTILRTTDGGITWTSASTGITDWFSGVAFTSASTGIVVGSYGTILRTTDGGSTWTLQTSGPRTSLYGVQFTDSRTGTVVGYRGAIFRTTDGGATWVTQSSGTKEFLWGISFPDLNTGVAVGEQGTIIRTTNGGTTWINQSINAGVGTSFWFSGVSFGSQRTGLVVGKRDSSYRDPTGRPVLDTRSMVLRTRDGGTNWSRLPFSITPWLLAVSFGDTNTATVVGEGGRILCTADGGETWKAPGQPVTTVRLNGVSSIGASTATVVGDYGTIFRTTDGGTTWTTQQSGTQERLNGVWFVNANYGLAVGDSGTMLRTSNGGVTWIPQPKVTTKALYAVSFSDASRGTVVGDGGTILRTTPGDITVGVSKSRESSALLGFALAQNYPNPFNGMTNFELRISNFGFATLKVFDLLGREVATLVDEERQPGVYRVTWDASHLPSGVYFYRLRARGFVETKKMILLR